MKAAVAIPPTDRIPAWAKTVLVFVGAALFLTALAVAPIPMRPYLDFQVLYHADLGLLRGIPVYDHAGQVAMIAQLANVPPEQVYVLPFPYPPWYALSTLWLALLPIEVAARVWLALGLVLLVLAVWLLTEGWPTIKRLVAVVLAFFFLPALGSLLVGQFVFPVLFGAALMIHALRHEKALLTAIAAALLTFKPHLGGLVLLAVLFHLWQRKDAFGRRALAYTVGAGVLLFAVGFLADKAWPVDYIRSLLGFQQDSGVASCGLCASLPVLLADAVSRNAGLTAALGIGGVVLIALAALWLVKRPQMLKNPESFIAVAALIVLLASPYLLNYDFVLLLIPLALLSGKAHSFVDWLVVGVVYVLPFVALALLNRQGNFVFPLCALVLSIALYCNAQQLDGSPAAA